MRLSRRRRSRAAQAGRCADRRLRRAVCRPQDFATIDRFHRTFIDAGLSLKFQSGAARRSSYYPTYRELLFETDREKRRGNFLVSEDDYQFVRGLQQRDAIVPVVGDLAGRQRSSPSDAPIRQRGEALSVFYVSNVELYLFQDGVLPRYVENLATIPRNDRSVIIRSVFSGPAVWSLPDALPGYASASLVQTIDDFTSRKYCDLRRDSFPVPVSFRLFQSQHRDTETQSCWALRKKEFSVSLCLCVGIPTIRDRAAVSGYR